MSERPQPPTEDDLPDELLIAEVSNRTAQPATKRSRGMLGILLAALLGSVTAFGLFFAARSYLLPSQEPHNLPERSLPAKLSEGTAESQPGLNYPDLVSAEERSGNRTAPSGETGGNRTETDETQSPAVASTKADPADEPFPGTNSEPNSVRPAVSNNTPVESKNTIETPIENSQKANPGFRRHPKPDQNALAQATQEIDAAFAAQIRNAKTREEKTALVHGLQTAAQGEPSGSATRFVLLERAHRLAVDAPDPALTNELVSVITGEYDVDSFDYRFFAVDQWDRMRIPNLDPVAEKMTHRVLAREAANLGDEAYQRKDFKTAAVMYALSSKRRERADDREIANLFRKKRTAARTKETRYTLASSLLKGLEEAPDDAEKNLEAGIACLQAGLWDEGLECLSKSGDETLKTFAAEQLQLRKNPDSWLEAGDKSWDAVRQLDRRHSIWLKELAVAEYESVLSSLTPLQLQKVKLRMQQVGAVSCVLPVEIQRFAFEPEDFVEIDKLKVLQNRMGHFGNGQLYGTQNLGLGIRGSALTMDGRETMVVCPESEFLIPGDWPFTISIWINSGRSQDVVIAGRTYRQSSAVKSDFQMRLLSTGHFMAMLTPETGGEISVESRDAVPQGQWTHLAMTWDLQTLRLYRNGREDAAFNVNSPFAERILANRAWMAIGAEHRSNPRFQGKVDEMRVYDQALSPLQIYHVYLEDQTPQD